jgi:hypothetical protein
VGRGSRERKKAQALDEIMPPRSDHLRLLAGKIRQSCSFQER